MKPLAIDLFCGLGGWAEGFLAEGWRVIGYDITRHDYGNGSYPGELLIQDVLTLHGSQFADAQIIVASPSCQEYSYRAMPWSRAKALPPPDNSLFNSCFRIQREASESAGRYIPLIVENVRGAQKWVGRAKWHFGSYYLWGDVPALMPMMGWKKITASCSERRWEDRDVKRLRDNFGWANSMMREGTSHGAKRRAASAEIAKIPFPLAQHIARCFKPQCVEVA